MSWDEQGAWGGLSNLPPKPHPVPMDRSFHGDGKQTSPTASSITAMSPLILVHAECPDMSNRIKGEWSLEVTGQTRGGGTGVRTRAGGSEFWGFKPWEQSSSAQGNQVYTGKEEYRHGLENPDVPVAWACRSRTGWRKDSELEGCLRTRQTPGSVWGLPGMGAQTLLQG